MKCRLTGYNYPITYSCKNSKPKEVEKKEPPRISKILFLGLSLAVWLPILILVFYHFDFFVTLYGLVIFIGSFVGLVLIFVMLPIATYKEMKAQIRKLEDENDKLKKQLSKTQP